MKIQLYNLISSRILSIGSNRFNYKIVIENEVFDCYVASTSHLSKYLNIANTPCLVIKNKSNHKYPYTLIGIKYLDDFLLANFNMVSTFFKFKYFPTAQKEKKFYNGYKADLFLEEASTIVEIKAIMNSKTNIIQYPDTSSLRKYKQLHQLKDLSRKYKVDLIFCLLTINNQYIEFSNEYKDLLHELQNEGVFINFYQLYINNNHEVILNTCDIKTNLFKQS